VESNLGAFQFSHPDFARYQPRGDAGRLDRIFHAESGGR
jgi:hypothetical protein